MTEYPNFHLMNGLLPIVIQDHETHEVLMVGYMNQDAWNLTISTGKIHYYSRKKQRIWMKGEQSGNFQYVKDIFLNCDNTCLLARVEQIGGACDQGYKSCFDKKFVDGDFKYSGDQVFDPQNAYGTNYTDKIVVGIPSGSLENMTFELLKLAGFEIEREGNRCYFPKIKNDPTIELIMARAQELPSFLEGGQLDLAITGSDLVEDSGASLHDLTSLGYNKLGLGSVSLALAVPNNSAIVNVRDFDGKRIATMYPNITQRFFLSHNVSVMIIPSIGATEGKVPRFADAIVDLVETGSTLKANNLTPIFSIFETTVHLYTSHITWGYTWKRRKIESLAELLVSASQKLPPNPKTCVQLPKLES